jgi:hypothetical protein
MPVPKLVKGPALRYAERAGGKKEKLRLKAGLFFGKDIVNQYLTVPFQVRCRFQLIFASGASYMGEWH